MNATVDLWDYLLSPAALLREVQPEANIWFGGKKQLPQHELVVKTPKTVDPNNIYLVISNDSNGLKCVPLSLVACREAETDARSTGSFFVRRNGFMSAFVDLWRDPYLTKNK